ncbi:ClpP/crotonase [Gonapodya prolifera JEL478]|uniref:ClpP/crotonase n=1 Tax=Gonapodya prolifera (strain JEL478) TaxID=1344416 RepID=A0A139ADC3_GONPJ|nr:ClpP/crotonase [Gonapodya prolifera JEL478]|eukprot:KXS14770.1 ClpP/crotonase [Gonapodya prolifera JEL478]
MSSEYPDEWDPLSEPPSKRYAKFNEVEGLKVWVEEDEKVLWIRFNRPHRLNAITQAGYNALHGILDMLLLDRQIRVVVLSGEGKGFSSGLDFDSANKAPGPDHKTLFFNQRKYSLLPLKFRTIPQPVISLMKGKIVGSGLAYALSADVRIADPTLSISSGANRMGLGGTDIALGWLLPRLCGWSATSEILLTFRWLDAERCLRSGLVSTIVPADKLDDEGRKMAKDMLELSHLGLIVTKMNLNAVAEGASMRSAITAEDTAQIFAGSNPEAAVINERLKRNVQKGRVGSKI